jgi:hypothetical protein
VQRLVAIPLLLLVMIWPVETAIATTAMASAHSCCAPKHTHHCHSSDGTTIAPDHSHEQCPMDCCSKRHASGNAIAANPAALRILVVQLQQAVIRRFEAHSVLAIRSDRERGPPPLS